MHGYGKYLLKNDKVFVEGYWDKGILKKGRIFLPNGDIYEGDIENNEYDGKGKTWYCPNCSKTDANDKKNLDGMNKI